MDIESLKAEGRAFLEPLVGSCVKCSLRRRSSFGWVWEACGLCSKGGAYGQLRDRLADQSWLDMPKWGAKYLAGDSAGPLPAPWIVFQTRSVEPQMAAPGWVVRLLLLGNPMKSYVRKTGGIAIQWPKLFSVVAFDETKRAAIDATVLLSGGNDTFSPSEPICASLYTFLLELETSVFGGAAQENTQLRPNRITNQDFAPPIRVVGKLVR